MKKISKRILIVGGGNIGFNLAKKSWRNFRCRKSQKLLKKIKIELNFLANELNNTIIINGNGLDEEVLIEANLEEAENCF